jgi:hypothetical protein
MDRAAFRIAGHSRAGESSGDGLQHSVLNGGRIGSRHIDWH